jgi:hypothetical protein
MTARINWSGEANCAGLKNLALGRNPFRLATAKPDFLFIQKT